MFVCQDPMPLDCIDRRRRDGSRRFEYTVSVASDGDYWGSGSLAFAVNQGLKRVFIVAEPWAIAIVTQLRATAAQLGLQVSGVQMVIAFGSDWSALNTSAAEVTERIQDMSVDLVIVVSGFPTPTITQLVDYWRQIDYLPAAVSFLAGGPTFIPEDLRGYFLLEAFWFPQLTGPSFHAVSSDTNFETMPSNATHDSPAIFADAYRARFEVQVPLASSFYTARAWHAVTIVQQLVELAQSEETENVRYASTRIATPGVYHAVQFDQWGRSMPFDNYVMQFMPNGDARVLTPLGLGSAPVLPIPNWSEREYKSVFLEKKNDRIAFSLAAVTVLYIVGWLVWLASQRHHPLIRVAGPLAYSLSLCGLIVLASACFFATFWQNDETCAAFAWFFIVGLTLGFAPLVLKNLRIWSMWHNSASFRPAPIRQRHTATALCVLLLIDIAVLTAWQASTGILTFRISPDPYRPSLDYYSCDVYAHSRGFVIGAIMWKLLMLALAMYLAYLLRNVSSKYSESRFIALCVYNVTVVLAIFVPVSATNAAGHEGTYLVRNYLLLFLCVSTASIMFGQSKQHRRARSAHARRQTDLSSDVLLCVDLRRVQFPSSSRFVVAVLSARLFRGATMRHVQSTTQDHRSTRSNSLRLSSLNSLSHSRTDLCHRTTGLRRIQAMWLVRPSTALISHCLLPLQPLQLFAWLIFEHPSGRPHSSPSSRCSDSRRSNLVVPNWTLRRVSRMIRDRLESAVRVACLLAVPPSCRSPHCRSLRFPTPHRCLCCNRRWSW